LLVIFNQLTRLIAREDFINFCHRESFRCYACKLLPDHLPWGSLYHTCLPSLFQPRQSPESSVGTGIVLVRYGQGDQGIGNLFAVSARFVLLSIASRPALWPNRFWRPFHPVCEAHLYLTPRLKNKWSYIFIPPLAFMGWCLIKQGHDFAFNFSPSIPYCLIFNVSVQQWDFSYLKISKSMFTACRCRQLAVLRPNSVLSLTEHDE
jgi:hypothetical protein